MRATGTVILITLFHLWLVDDCSAGELLFAKATRNYDWPGAVGEAYRRELEPRLFPHEGWRQRLYCETADAEANETMEIYRRSDGSYWLDTRRATPALSPIIRYRPYLDQRAELIAKLAKVKISSCETPLPFEVVKEIARLWDTMLPGVDVAPVPETFSSHGPAFIAFARNGQAIKTGSICIAAYDTKPYHLFVEIVNDLKKLCRADSGARESLYRTLAVKLRTLSQRLGLKTASSLRNQDRLSRRVAENRRR